MKLHPRICRGVIAIALLAVAVPAQRRSRLEPLRSSPTMKAAFKEVVAAANPCTTKIYCDGKLIAFGTVVASDGLVVTKASELDGNELQCVFGERKLTARIAGTDTVNDLALLRVDSAADLVVADWAEAVPSRGAWLATPDGSELPAGIGILSSAPYQHSRSKGHLKGYLGVERHPDPTSTRLKAVQDGTAAAEAGLKAEDVILQIDDRKIESWDELSRMIGGHKPGERIKLRVKRGEEELELVAKLGSNRQGRRESQARIWGPLSGVRAGFGEVLQHDTVLRPEQCGGPLVDLTGKVIGVNIARAGRVETLALPAATVREAVADIQARAARSERKK